MQLSQVFAQFNYMIQLKNIYIEEERGEIIHYNNRQLSPINYSNLYH